MKNYCLLLLFPFLLTACQNQAQKKTEQAGKNETVQPVVKEQPVVADKSPLEGLNGFLGLWKQDEGIDLVSYEEWKKVSNNFYQARSWTMYGGKQVYEENIELRAENGEIFYIPHVVENQGPVRFKMTSLEGNLATFENPEHDFPQKITYEMRGDTMLFARISGAKNGKEGSKEFPLRRAN